MNPSPGMRVLVSGASGFLGRHLVAGLRERFRVRGLDLAPLEGHADFVTGSVDDPAVAERAMEGIDALVVAHMVPNRPGAYDRVAEPFDVNVKGTALLFESAARRGVRRAVLVSSIAVAERDRLSGERLDRGRPPAPTTLYGLTKTLQEAIARHHHENSGMEVAVLRPAYVVREDTLLDKYGRRLPSVNWQFIDPRDIAAAVAAALTRPGLGFLTGFLVAGPGAEAHTDAAQTQAELGWEPRHRFADYPVDAPEPAP